MSEIRCDGFRRYGGAFSLGPVLWEQCKNTAIVRITCIQNGKEETFGACGECWNEAIDNEKIEITHVVPITRGV